MSASVGCTVNLKVQPGASRNRISVAGDGVVLLSVTAPPHDGRANAAVVALLATRLGVAKSRLRIVRGHASRHKVVEVEGIAGAELERRLDLKRIRSE